MGAMPWPHADETFCRECLDRLANHAASDPETDFQIMLGGQRLADRDDILRDLAAERRQHRMNAARFCTLVGGFRARPQQDVLAPGVRL